MQILNLKNNKTGELASRMHSKYNTRGGKNKMIKTRTRKKKRDA